MKVAIIIPARFNATRFQGKLLKGLGNKTILEHVYEKAKTVQGVNAIIIATDDDRIYQSALAYTNDVVMTSSSHLSGTDRCAEVAEKLKDFHIVVNIQGDEPFVDPIAVEELIESLKHETVKIATLMTKVEDEVLVNDQNVVKVVIDKDSNALYFSRAAIPNITKSNTTYVHMRHIGVYGFKRNILIELAKLPHTPLEVAESLEQLRWMENGYKIQVLNCAGFHKGIDTSADLADAENYLNKECSQI